MFSVFLSVIESESDGLEYVFASWDEERDQIWLLDKLELVFKLFKQANSD